MNEKIIPVTRNTQMEAILDSRCPDPNKTSTYIVFVELVTDAV